MKDTIILFGSTGMLGNYVLNEFQRNYQVIAINRATYDIYENDMNKLTELMEIYRNSVVINCAGAIPQRSTNKDDSYFIINSLFPKMLEHICIKLNNRLIHMSTNCVFNYTQGLCNEETFPNEKGPYGLSKTLGEPTNACVIRASIIGEECENKKSLLEWVISNKNGEIDGYDNYLWNGCTCLTIAKYTKFIVDSGLYHIGVRHIHSNEIISKYDLVCMINEIYKLNIKINRVELDVGIEKTLNSIYKSTYQVKSLKEQILEQKTK